MSSRQITLIIAAALLAGTFALGGCSKPTVQQPSASTTVTSQTATPTQESVESSDSSDSTPISATGPIASPAAGSAERSALLAAARTELGTTSQFYVYQLYAQGDTALGDLAPVSGSVTGRFFVALERHGGVWKAVNHWKFGSADANAASVARALPGFSAELVGKIDWKVAKSSPGSTSQSTSLKSSLSVAAKAWSKTEMDGAGSPYKITLVKVAQDSKKVWWGHVVVQPTGDANNSYEPLDYWAKYVSGKWQGKVQDPEPPAPSTYFPSSVISKLGL